MCYFLFYFILQFLHTQCYSDDNHAFTHQFFNENGSIVLPFHSFNQESLWIRFSSNKNNSETFWLKLQSRQANHIPILIKKDEHYAKMDKRTSDCLFSAASALVPYTLASNISTEKEFQQQIQAASTKATKYEPTQFLTVSLCHGISGIVQLFNSASYVVIQSNSSLVHLQNLSTIFFHEKMSGDDPLHRELFHIADRAVSRHKRLKRSSFNMPVRLQQPGPFLVELYIIVDPKMASYHSYDNYKLINRVASIINYLNMVFSQFNIYFTVVQLEIWEYDFIKPSNENNILMDLQSYKRRHITKKHDCLHAILGENHGSSRRGQSEPSSMCGYNSCVGYSKDYSDQRLIELSHSVLHEIGHNFGLHHDTEQCQCYDCIMATGVEFASDKLRWSNCSMKEMSSLLHSGIADCLRDRPVSNLNELNPVIIDQNYGRTSLKGQSLLTCGNGVVDEGEQCDCDGNQCSPEFAKCCNPATCKFRSGATCAGGTCCNLDKCSIKSTGTVCRNTKGNNCDLPEYCDGKTEWCPPDVYKENSTECTTSTTGQAAFCYRGNCHTRQSWCQVLWGDTANEANNDCFLMNKEGKDVKNCGLEIPHQIDREKQTRNWINRKCTDENVKCGRLWCSHDNERVLRYSSSLFDVDEMIGNSHCSAIRFDMDFFMYDAGMVPNGAPCNYRKMCLAGDCVASSHFKIAKCYCNGHGVCNNNQNCHCDAGFAPPNCTSSGDGGSIDSGPPGKFHSTVRTVIAAVIITLVVILTILLIASFIYHYRTRSWPMILTWIKCPSYRMSQSTLRMAWQRYRIKRMELMKTNESNVTLLSELKPEESGHVATAIKLPGDSVIDESPKFATGKGEKKYAQVKHSYILNVDINSAGQKIHISPLQSPKAHNSPDAKSKKEAFNKLRSFLEVKQSKDQSQVNSENHSSKKPVIISPKPKPLHESREISKTASKPDPVAPEILSNKPTPKVFSTPKAPPILIEKPSKLTETVSPPVFKEKPGRLAELQESKSDQTAVGKTSNIRALRPEMCAIFEGDKRPPISGDKPQKPVATTGPQISIAKPSKTVQGDNFKPVPKLSNLGKVPPVTIQKQADLKSNPKLVAKDAQALPNKITQNRSIYPKPVSETPAKPKPDNTVPNKLSGVKIDTLNRKLESVTSKSQISQPKLEHTTNQSMGSNPPVKSAPALAKLLASQSEPVAPKIMSPGNDKPKKSIEVDEMEKPPVKLSKLQISQPRLNQTTCTDGTVNLVTTDRTLTRTVAPHKILKCDPSKAGKYL